MSSQSPEDEKKKAQALQQQKQEENSSESKPEETQKTPPSNVQPPPPPMPKPSTPIASTAVARPVASTPIGRPVTSTPVGTRVGTVGKPAGAATTLPTKPTVPQKPVESKQDISRRNFLKAIALVGGLIMVGSFGVLFPFVQGSVESATSTAQVILDIKTLAPIKTTDIPQNNFAIFIWPRTGNPAIDADSFHQFVAIHLPPSLTAPANLSAKDPISGDAFIAFSRVCLHLWCLWNYIPNDRRMECPCHGSQYVPGYGEYPNFPVATDQPPGKAVAGPASLQTPPNNIAPVALLSIAPDGTISATKLIGQVGCGQLC